MPRECQLLIVANGLREQSGHYMETTVALAEAARRFDCRPIVGAHVDCPADLLPTWLDNQRIFRTDHWMRPPICEQAHSAASGAPLSRGCLAAPSPIRRPTARQRARGAVRFAKVAARYAMPPLAYDLARVLVNSCLPRMVRRQQRNLARHDLRVASLRWKFGAAAEHARQAAAWPAIVAALDDARLRPRIVDALHDLAPLGLLAELNHALVFRQDLQQFLEAAGAGPDDHVVLPTAHAREVLAIHLIVERLGLAASPTFHLEFRHPLFEGDGTAETAEESPGAMMQRAFFRLHAAWGTSSRVKFYTDADALARDYESISGIAFDVLPLPFRAELIPHAGPRTNGPLTIAYLGGARDEKGFPWLPDLVRELRMRNSPGRVRFLIQSNISNPEHNPHSAAALPRLQALGGNDMELVALDDGLPPADYYRLFSSCDLVLLPYLPSRYRACTSGVLAEALAAGIPAVVPAGTWLASQLPRGAGEIFDGFDSFVEAVQQVVDNRPRYRAAAEAARAGWLLRHTPDAVVAALLKSTQRTSGRFASAAAA